MSSNYPEGSMRGSGIYAEEFEFPAFDCEECGENNPEDIVVTNDWGNYDVSCTHCGALYTSGNLSDDAEAAAADAAYDAWSGN